MDTFIKASIFMILSSCSCIINDVLAKFFQSTIGDLLFYRFFFATIFCFIFYRSKKIITFNNLIRGCLFSLSMLFFIIGLKNLPLPFVILINFAVPIWSTILSKIILKEKIQNRLIICICNTLCIIWISYESVSSKDIKYIVCLFIASLLFSFMEIFSKISINNNESPNDIILGSFFFSSIMFLPFISFEILSAFNYSLLILISITSVAISYFLLKASQYAELSSLQPLKYIEFPMTILANSLFFKEIIAKEVYIGFSIIIIITTINYFYELNR